MENANKNSVLIIDDEPSNIVTLHHMLNPDYTIYGVTDGLAGLTAAKTKNPSLILLDILMPDMDGFEVLSQLKNTKETRDIPVILITRLDNDEAEEKGLLLGADDYLQKPFNSIIVKLRVQNVLKIAKRNGREKSEFLSRMNHEMLSPMNTIIGSVQTAMKYDCSDKIISCLNRINDASLHLVKMIENVLNISGERNIFSITESTFSIHELIDFVQSRINPDLIKTKHILTLDISPAIPETLIGDEKRISQVLVHLLSNAIKFSPEKSDISFGAYIHADDDGTIILRFEITDEGIGISYEHQKDIFDLFEQVDGGIARKYSGIGVGLPLSKNLANMMGGDIWVESEIGKGAKFYFTCKTKR